MDPEVLPGSRSGIIVPDPDPAQSERVPTYKNKTVNSGLFELLDSSIE